MMLMLRAILPAVHAAFITIHVTAARAPRAGVSASRRQKRLIYYARRRAAPLMPLPEHVAALTRRAAMPYAAAFHYFFFFALRECAPCRLMHAPHILPRELLCLMRAMLIVVTLCRRPYKAMRARRTARACACRLSLFADHDPFYAAMARRQLIFS